MNGNRAIKRAINLRSTVTPLFRTASLALMLALALPCMAADTRAVKSKVAPIYPEIAQRMKIAGLVKLEATVDPDGKVTGVKILSGNSMLSVASEDAVRKWRFAPAAAASTVPLSFSFGAAQ